ncbi:MAG: helix-turn-helix domain-containing protein, partial [Oscillospiraceae bacterium]|nr:helix-turn-helix domain-containing protein [Oscillospiraceae bacterium]
AFRVIGQLTKYSDPSGIDLLGTLQTYIDCNYNISLTARNLYIHRQSLLYRLGKIEELTGMSLHDHKHLFLLEIYSHIHSGY